ncbi:DUF6603 domain-containing protein [Nocardia sp. NPDC088792]|uniref:DUF6603 domain-containing protein n=1 Tax=Nocardia sp. NPDC088792 TaxID=3364332 RepID=UPI0038260C9E
MTLYALQVATSTTSIGLSDVPLVGGLVPPAADLAVTGVRVIATSQQLDRTMLDKVNAAVRAADPELPKFPSLPQANGSHGLPQGAVVTVDYMVPGDATSTPLVIPLTRNNTQRALGRSGDDSTGVAVWVPVGRTFGPLQVDRLGAALEQGTVWLLLDASLIASGVSIGVSGLGLGIDLNDGFRARTRLSGLAVGVNRPPVRVEGMLVNRIPPPEGYDLLIEGMLVVELPQLGAVAIAAYQRRRPDGMPSLFALCQLSGLKLGAPPKFVITAISAGVGINSSVRVPTQSEVAKFPLVSGMDSEAGTPQQVLASLTQGPQPWVTPAAGQLWIAGGLDFTVFNFIATRALLLVEVGDSWKVLLAGKTTVDLPRNKASKNPLARVIVNFAIAYQSNLDQFSMDAVIAPGSYILDPAAALTGGISFYVWGEAAPGGRKGFVITAGGYHPAFRIPDHYPRPPRVGWSWARDNLAIQGQVYGAVTDGALMAGGRLAAAYDNSHGVELRAWFTAYVDAIVQWKPFSFDVNLGVSIGLSATIKVWFVRVRVSLDVAVALQLWGPPIGGRAWVKVWFLSFALDFGTHREPPAPVAWSEFREQLPAPIRINLEQGGLADVSPTEIEARNSANQPTLVSVDGFTVVTEAALPATGITLNDAPVTGAAGGVVNIRPMSQSDVTSTHKVTLTRNNQPFNAIDAGWTVTVVRRDMPRALWGKPLQDPNQALQEDGQIDGCAVGLRLQAPAPAAGPAVGPVTSAALGLTDLAPGNMPLRNASPIGPAPTPAPNSIQTITDTMAANAAVIKRRAAHAALAALGVAPGTDGAVTRYARLAGSTLTAPPMTTASTR